MKKITIVDNGSDTLDRLVHSLQNLGHECQIIEPSKLKAISESTDIVVLSGGYWYDDPSVFSQKYQKEIDFIQETSRPILGICLGMQLIALALGGEVNVLKREYHQPISLELTSKARDFGWYDSPKQLYFENHTMGVIKMPNNFIELAKSEESFEIIIHERKPIIGVQFHPELLSKSQHTLEIWESIFSLLNKNTPYN